MSHEGPVRSEIKRMVRHHEANRLPGGTGPIFAEPLVGFASATHRLFRDYKSIIGPFHLTPAELFAAELGADAPEPATIVCWVLPVASEIRRSNRRQTRLPSREWAQMRAYGEEFNEQLRREVVSLLESWGHSAVAPQLSSSFVHHDDGPAGIATSWSERHAAYAAGLGTFSLNDGLITPKGIAHRLGSVVTDLVIPAGAPVEGDRRGYCLAFRNRECTTCIRRCPAGALSEEGHDKDICSEYVYSTVLAEVGDEYGVSVTGCGLCQTKVPCEIRVPPEQRSQAGGSTSTPRRR